MKLKSVKEVIDEIVFYLENINLGVRKMRCFVFTGQGSQFLGMGKDILELKPEYNIYFDKVKKK